MLICYNSNMKILKFLGLILFNIAYLCINIYLCFLYYAAIYLVNVLKISPASEISKVTLLTIIFVLLVWITKFLFFPILLTISSKIKYTKKIVKLIKDNIVDKTSTLIQAILFDSAILLYAAIYSKFVDDGWFSSTLLIFILCGGGVLPAYLSMSLWSFLNNENTKKVL